MIESILNNGLMVVLLVLFFGITIFVHELGHFLVARWCGLVVDVFSIGFGPAIWKRKIGDVVYKIGVIPFGGYVALPQLDPAGMSKVQGAPDGGEVRMLPRISPWKKILVSVAGAVGNIILAIALAWIVYWVGIPAGPEERSSEVGFVDPESPAYAAGLRIGDRILSINGIEVSNWNGVRLEAALRHEVVLDVGTPSGERKTLTITTGKGILGEQSIEGVDGPNLCMVLDVEPGMSAAEAGLQRGDVIVRFGEEAIYSREHLIYLVSKSEGVTVPVMVRREAHGRATLLTRPVTPRMDPKTKQVRIGISFNVAARDLDVTVHPRPSEQIREHATAILHFLQALVTPKHAKAASAAVGGPVAIVASYWLIVKTSIMLAIWFTGFLNVNLAIINLLPIPVLDGGHICFALWEGVTRRPLSPRVVNAMVNTFAVLLITVFVYLTFRDVGRFTPVGRIVSEWRSGGTEAVTNAVPAE